MVKNSFTTFKKISANVEDFFKNYRILLCFFSILKTMKTHTQPLP